MGEVERGAHRLLQLAAVGLEDRRPLVGEELLELGVHDHRHAAPLREHHRPLDHAGRERPLVVVLDHQRVRVGHGRFELARELLLGAGRDGVLHLFVDPHQLLAARHDAGLGRRGPRRRDHEMPVGEARLGQLAAQRVAARVVPDHRDQPALGADRRHVRRHVRRPAQRVPPVMHRDHGHRRLRRDPLGLPQEVDIQHRVAHDDDATLRHLAQ